MLSLATGHSERREQDHATRRPRQVHPETTFGPVVRLAICTGHALHDASPIPSACVRLLRIIQGRATLEISLVLVRAEAAGTPKRIIKTIAWRTIRFVRIGQVQRVGGGRTDVIPIAVI